MFVNLTERKVMNAEPTAEFLSIHRIGRNFPSFEQKDFRFICHFFKKLFTPLVFVCLSFHQSLGIFNSLIMHILVRTSLASWAGGSVGPITRRDKNFIIVVANMGDNGSCVRNRSRT